MFVFFSRCLEKSTQDTQKAMNHYWKISGKEAWYMELQIFSH